MNPDPVSDEEEESSDSASLVESSDLKGALQKWTNYIHGWQERYIVVSGRNLMYYKSENESGFGCRGSIALSKATIKSHESDECRFDVSVKDCTWYLRAETPEEKQHWVDALEALKEESGYGSESSLKRHGSAVSLTSNTLSSNSSSSFKIGRAFKEKIAEMETYRDILCTQMDKLQEYFDSCDSSLSTCKLSSNNKESDIRINNKELALVDFKGDAMTFKATSEAVLCGLTQCMDLLNQREELWRKRLVREQARINKLEETCDALRKNVSISSGPDLEEGPNSALCEDEFYDAVESALERLEEEVALRQQLKLSSAKDPLIPTGDPKTHPLWSEIVKITEEQMHYASIGVGEGPWQLFAEEGDMKLYRREEEVNGLVMDPLKACHIVKGVTGREVCHYFFSPQYRKDWETTLEQMTVLEKISDDTLVFLQVHKRIWPTAQRDALFWSHQTHKSDPQDEEGHDIWAVVNHSTNLPQYPAKSSKCVRVSLTVCLYCQTLITPPKDGEKVTRDDITCKITYCSVVNPGGWVPATALRALYKREYPKFLKRFIGYVKTQTIDNEIMF